jgi:hypothetical protein
LDEQKAIDEGQIPGKNPSRKEVLRKQQITFAIAGDPKREVYGKYATGFIPRNITSGKNRTILFQSVGSDETEFRQMLEAIGKAL